MDLLNPLVEGLLPLSVKEQTLKGRSGLSTGAHKLERIEGHAVSKALGDLKDRLS